MENHSLAGLKEMVLALLAPLVPTAHESKPPVILKAAALDIARLHGDASNRIYYRVTTPLGPFILMERPLTALESPSEEITKEKNKSKEYAFLNIQRYLELNGVRVPKIFATSTNEQFILLEDLGPGVFEKKLNEEPQNLRALYQKAIALLHSWQQLKAPADASCVAWSRSFDADLLNWEFEHFIEWGVEKGQNVTLPRQEAAELRRIFGDLTQEICSFATRLVHRDFQSRNLMVLPEEDNQMAILDFQDALVGPHCYDLVALLRDSYIDLQEEDLVFLQNHYMTRSGVASQSQFLRDFDVQTVQRKLKDGGRFHYINLFKKNPSFLPHVPNSFKFAHRAINRIPEGKHLMPILRRYLREFND